MISPGVEIHHGRADKRRETEPRQPASSSASRVDALALPAPIQRQRMNATLRYDPLPAADVRSWMCSSLTDGAAAGVLVTSRHSVDRT
jgi:hypothetical protein